MAHEFLIGLIISLNGRRSRHANSLFPQGSLHCLSLVTSETFNNNKSIIGSPGIPPTDLFSQFAEAHFRHVKELYSILPIL
jgi:hypothetical protein